MKRLWKFVNTKYWFAMEYILLIVLVVISQETNTPSNRAFTYLSIFFAITVSYTLGAIHSGGVANG